MYYFPATPQKCKKILTTHRKITTDIPSPETIETLRMCAINEPNSMND